MSKLPRGTSQAALEDESGLYIIEEWDGRTWTKARRMGFANKRAADEWGFANMPRHKR